MANRTIEGFWITDQGELLDVTFSGHAEVYLNYIGENDGIEPQDRQSEWKVVCQAAENGWIRLEVAKTTEIGKSNVEIDARSPSKAALFALMRFLKDYPYDHFFINGSMVVNVGDVMEAINRVPVYAFNLRKYRMAQRSKQAFLK